jgi:acyl-ACP thioesterase
VNDHLEPLVAVLDDGRRFTRSREVRLSDAAHDGRVRLDALACYLQDVANDDAREAIGEDAAAWVVRRTVIDVFAWPRFQEPVEMTTFCGGTGGRWAERRTSILGAIGGHVEAASLWVHIDMTTGRPVPLPPSFLEQFGGGWASRKVTGRLTHPAPDQASPSRAWMFRSTDFDVMGHVNNAAYWAVVEDVLLREHAPSPARFELEYRLPVEPDHATDVIASDDYVWLVSPAREVHASARVIPLR